LVLAGTILAWFFPVILIWINNITPASQVLRKGYISPKFIKVLVIVDPLLSKLEAAFYLAAPAVWVEN